MENQEGRWTYEDKKCEPVEISGIQIYGAPAKGNDNPLAGNVSRIIIETDLGPITYEPMVRMQQEYEVAGARIKVPSTNKVPMGQLFTLFPEFKMVYDRVCDLRKGETMKAVMSFTEMHSPDGKIYRSLGKFRGDFYLKNIAMEGLSNVLDIQARLIQDKEISERIKNAIKDRETRERTGQD